MEEDWKKSIAILESDTKKYIGEISPFLGSSVYDYDINVSASNTEDYYIGLTYKITKILNMNNKFNLMSKTFNDNIDRYKEKIKNDMQKCDIIYKSLIDNVGTIDQSLYDPTSLNPLAIAKRLQFAEYADLFNMLLGRFNYTISDISYMESHFISMIRKYRIPSATGVNYKIIKDMALPEPTVPYIYKPNQYEMRYEILLDTVINLTTCKNIEMNNMSIKLTSESIINAILESIDVTKIHTRSNFNSTMKSINIYECVYNIIYKQLASMLGRRLMGREMKISMKLIQLDIAGKIKVMLPYWRINDDKLLINHAKLREYIRESLRSSITDINYPLPGKIKYILNTP